MSKKISHVGRPANDASFLVINSFVVASLKYLARLLKFHLPESAVL